MTPRHNTPYDAGLWRRAAQISAVGIEMVAAVVGGALVGRWADQRWGWGGAGMLVGLGIGLGAAISAVVRVVRQLQAPSRRSDGKK